MRNLRTSVAGAFLCAALLSSQTSVAITVSASVVGNLPSNLVESSGLDHTGGTHFWSLNDSGNPEIYRIAGDGSLTRTVTITNANNRNWEDIAHDVNRTYMFIGDFGNNMCDRTNLKIYRIPYPSGVTANSVTADQISFSYEDQERFPSPWMNFDVEAFIHFQGQLFLFTKTDGSAIGYTKMYVIPDVPGTYVAMLVDSFYTNDRTTGAAISPDGSSMVLISNTRIHLFRNYIGNDFFHGTHTLISIAGGWTQKEAVTFCTNRAINLTDEAAGGSNHLYYIDLSPWIPAAAITLGTENLNAQSGSVYPNPANDQVRLTLKGDYKDASVSIYDLTGKLTYQSQIENATAPFVINTAVLPPGVYFYRIYEEGQEIQTSRLVINH